MNKKKSHHVNIYLYICIQIYLLPKFTLRNIALLPLQYIEAAIAPDDAKDEEAKGDDDEQAQQDAKGDEKSSDDDKQDIQALEKKRQKKFQKIKKALYGRTELLSTCISLGRNWQNCYKEIPDGVIKTFPYFIKLNKGSSSLYNRIIDIRGHLRMCLLQFWYLHDSWSLICQLTERVFYNTRTGNNGTVGAHIYHIVGLLKLNLPCDIDGHESKVVFIDLKMYDRAKGDLVNTRGGWKLNNVQIIDKQGNIRKEIAVLFGCIDCDNIDNGVSTYDINNNGKGSGFELNNNRNMNNFGNDSSYAGSSGSQSSHSSHSHSQASQGSQLTMASRRSYNDNNDNYGINRNSYASAVHQGSRGQSVPPPDSPLRKSNRKAPPPYPQNQQ